MMEKLENTFMAMEGNIAQRLSRIEQRLESLETAVSCDKMTCYYILCNNLIFLKKSDAEAKMFLRNLTDLGVFFSTVELRYNEPPGNEVLGKRTIIILRHSNSKVIIWKRPSIYQGLVLANILFLPVPRPFTK